MVDTINLDFATVKSSLKTYLKAQSKLLDYDFEGSNISVLIDLLAYNATNTAFFTNMAISEMFLDTAIMKESVISHAKMLNYLPNSRKSATAVIVVTVDTIGFSKPDNVIIPKGTEFRSIINGKAFTFTNDKSIVMDNPNGDSVFIANNVTIFEGKYITDLFPFTGISTDTYILNSDLIDIDSLEVSIQNSSSDLTETVWKYSPTVIGLTASSEVFYIQPEGRNKYSISFGDDIISKGLVSGNIIKANYRLSRTNESFGAVTFTPVSSIQGFTNITISTVTSSSGGSEREGISSIKLNAPKHFQSQDRAITENDYKTLLTKQFPQIQTLSVYGGENLSPPQFGKVVIAIDILGSNGISDTTKTAISSYLKVKSPISIVPIIVNPDFIFIQLSISSVYDISVTTKTVEDLKSQIVAALTSYNTTTVNKFNADLIYSDLTTVINSSDNSLLSSDVTIAPFIKIAPTDLTVPLPTSSYKFFNEIKQVIQLSSNSDYSKFEAPVISTSFISEGKSVFIEDDGSGVLQLVSIDSNSKRNVVKNAIGKVDYLTGEVTLNELIIDSYSDDGIKLFILPKNKDFSGTQNVILTIDNNIVVSMTGKRT